MKNLETADLVLRRFDKKDAKEAYENWASVKKLADISDFSVHSNIEETKKIIQIGLGETDDDTYTWAIELKATKELVGFVRIYEVSKENKKCKIIWTLGYKWWHKGISNKAIKEIIKYLFEEEGFNVVVAEHYSDMEELRSPVLKDAGMLKEATLKARKVDSKTGKILDKIIYSVLNPNIQYIK